MNEELENGVILNGRLHLLTQNAYDVAECDKCSLYQECMSQKDDICICVVLGGRKSHFEERGELVKIVSQNPLLN